MAQELVVSFGSPTFWISSFPRLPELLHLLRAVRRHLPPVKTRIYCIQPPPPDTHVLPPPKVSTDPLRPWHPTPSSSSSSTPTTFLPPGGEAGLG